MLIVLGVALMLAGQIVGWRARPSHNAQKSD